MKISLTGFMGCGKSTVGKMLTRLLPGHSWTDLDTYIEKKSGRSVSEIFSSEGEAAFRRMEADCLDEILAGSDNVIISLGGGAVMTERCFNLVSSGTTCFYLKASPETIRQHLTKGGSLEEAAAQRPLLRDGKLEELMKKREPVYEAVADFTVCVDGRNAPDIANDIFYLIP